MMTNLFSVFDPSSSIFSLAWLTLMIPLSILPNSVWKMISPFGALKNKILNSLMKEISLSTGKSTKGEGYFLLLIATLIVSENIIALYPQVFSTTSHLVVNLPLSLIMWSTIILFSWIQTPNSMLAHLVPQGTPNALSSFMVLIELVSNLIRPITLCVRLTANLIAGHLLMTLLGNALISIPVVFTNFGMLALLTLTLLESAVACIQAYVFMTLVSLYINEIK